MKSQGRRR